MRDDRREAEEGQEAAQETPEPATEPAPEPRGGRPQQEVERAVVKPPETR